MTKDSTPEYEQLRDTLKKLLASPVPDEHAIDRVIDELERMQLVIKSEHGLKGNNPNE